MVCRRLAIMTRLLARRIEATLNFTNGRQRHMLSLRLKAKERSSSVVFTKRSTTTCCLPFEGQYGRRRSTNCGTRHRPNQGKLLAEGTTPAKLANILSRLYSRIRWYPNQAHLVFVILIMLQCTPTPTTYSSKKIP